MPGGSASACCAIPTCSPTRSSCAACWRRRSRSWRPAAERSAGRARRASIIPAMAPLRLALYQQNPTVGDIAANERAIAGALESARAAGAGLALFGELAVTGYPPEDLLYKQHFLRDA